MRLGSARANEVLPAGRRAPSSDMRLGTAHANTVLPVGRRARS